MNQSHENISGGRVLVAGWFSFEQMNSTAGDLLTRDLACQWLREAGHDYDVAVAPPFTGGVDWRATDPRRYRQVVFVCGPFRDNPFTAEFLSHFAGCRLIGLNLSMLDPLEAFNPFDVLLERDSTRTSRPDMSFGCPPPRCPVVGLLLVHPQPQYKKRARHDEVHDVIKQFVASREMAVVAFDTRLDRENFLRTPDEVEALIARMDVVITTRLHGTVLALKNGVPPVAVDPVAGGAKIYQQAKSVGWPTVFTPETLTDAALSAAFDECLTEAARARARACRDRGAKGVHALREEFIRAVGPVI